MFGTSFIFEQPWYLCLALLIIPALWWFSFRSLAGLGPVRRVVALSLRSLLVLLLVAALAGFQFQWASDRLAVLYLLDQSASIPEAQRQSMMEYVVKEVKTHRNRQREDLAGVIVFGRDALIEVPPFDDDIPGIGQVESLVGMRRDATNLAAALKLAQASFPEGTARRIVLVTDGNENLGDARAEAKKLSDAGIGIDVVPVHLQTRAEVAIEKVTIPPDVRRGQPYEVRVVVNNLTQPTDADPGFVKGKLTIVRTMGKSSDFHVEEEVTLKPGKNVYTFQQKVEQSSVYTYRAIFTPQDAQDDLIAQNNEATAFAHIRGKGKVLLIEDFASPGQFEFLVQRLRLQNLEVDVMPSNDLFTSLADLQPYDTVLLANVPRSSGDSSDKIANFTDDQISMLVRNTEQMGCGLIMLGGDASFGAGGWTNTELEKAMPVDFQIENVKVQAVGALVLMMHASEIPEGNHWQKVVARQAVSMLSAADYAGCIHWHNQASKESWLWNQSQGGLVRVGPNKSRMLSQIDRMSPGDMPDFDPAMRMALAGFKRVQASVKHMIVISDGDPSPPSPTFVAQCRANSITVSTVAVGAHGPAESSRLRNIAADTGGKYYEVRDPRALPRIYQRETRRVARPLVKDLPDVPPRMVGRNDIVEGINDPLPPIRGFVLTTVKDNPLVEVLMRSPEPDEPENSTVLASWTYGLGRAAAFTTDAGYRWSTSWKEWENYDKFVSQLVRWSMRPLDDQGKFSVASDIKDGKVRIVVTALDKDDEFLNFLNMSGAAITPGLTSKDIKIEQVAPGRYVGEFDAEQAGSYFLTISPNPGAAPLLSGINVPYSAEFRDHETNQTLITTIAGYRPQDGEAGRVIEGELARDRMQQLLDVDTFRGGLPRSISSRDLWPLVLLVAACLFFADVFVRRVTLSFEWVGKAREWVRVKVFGRDATVAEITRMERLRQSKVLANEQIDERRAAVRFQPQVDDSKGTPAPSLDEVLGDAGGTGPDDASRRRPAKSEGLAAGPADAESYTSRLLKAKQQSKRDIPKSDGGAGPS